MKLLPFLEKILVCVHSWYFIITCCLAIRARRFSAKKGNFENSRFPSKSDLVNSSNTDTTNSIVIPAAYLEAKANQGIYKSQRFKNLFISTIIGDVSVVHMLFPSLQDFLPSADK